MGQTNHGWFTVGPYDKQQSYLFKSVGGEFHLLFSDEQGDAHKKSHPICCDLGKEQFDIPIQG